MKKVKLNTRKDNKLSLTLADHGDCIIKVCNPTNPHREGTHRHNAFSVVRLMDGITVSQGNEVLRLLERNIQRRNGRPLGWIADACTNGAVEVWR